MITPSANDGQSEMPRFLHGFRVLARVSDESHGANEPLSSTVT